MTQPDLPLVSVCIPTYNRAERLRRAVAKLLACDYPNLEIVISDNGSSDHTQQVGTELAQASPQVRYFRHPVNQGPTRNFEFARAQATGKYFLWHGDDDYLGPDTISRCVRELEADPSLVLASGLAAYHRGDHMVTRLGNVIQPGGSMRLLRVLKYLFQVDENSIFCGAYRREAVAACTFPNFLAGDWAWVAEVLAEGRARVLPEVHVYREEGDGNTSRSLENIVRVHGLPAWHARFPWLAMPLNLANYLAFGSARYRGRWLPTRAALWLAVFSTCLLKQLLLRASGMVPLAGSLYRMLRGPRGAQPPRR